MANLANQAIRLSSSSLSATWIARFWCVLNNRLILIRYDILMTHSRVREMSIGENYKRNTTPIRSDISRFSRATDEAAFRQNRLSKCRRGCDRLRPGVQRPGSDAHFPGPGRNQSPTHVSEMPSLFAVFFPDRDDTLSRRNAVSRTLFNFIIGRLKAFTRYCFECVSRYRLHTRSLSQIDASSALRLRDRRLVSL